MNHERLKSLAVSRYFCWPVMEKSAENASPMAPNSFCGFLLPSVRKIFSMVAAESPASRPWK